MGERSTLKQVIVAAAALMVAFSAAPAAQWPRFPAPGAPRTADGRVNPDAPPPRTADGRPDLSGIWENPGWRDLARVTQNVSGTGGAPGTPRVLPPGPAQFFDLANIVPGGL